MWQMLKMEFKRSFRTKFLIALLVEIALVVSNVILEMLPEAKFMGTSRYWLKNDSPYSAFGWWIGGTPFYLQQYLYFFLMPVIAAIPCADSFFSDLKSGYIKNILVRTKKIKYYGAKYLVVFIVSGLTVVIPMLLSFGITAMIFPTILPEPTLAKFPVSATHMWSVLYYTRPFLYTLGYMAIDFIYGGLFAAVALTMTYYLEYRFVVLVSPFLLALFMNSVLNLFNLQSCSPLSFISPGADCSTTFMIVTCEALFLLLITMGIFFGKGLRKDTY